MTFAVSTFYIHLQCSIFLVIPVGEYTPNSRLATCNKTPLKPCLHWRIWRFGTVANSHRNRRCQCGPGFTRATTFEDEHFPRRQWSEL